MTVHWYDGSEAFARKALKIGDTAVRDTADLLGVTETDRIDFFIYGDQEASFRTALGPGTRENVGGQAHADIRTLFALISPDAINDSWVGIVIRHELVHLAPTPPSTTPIAFPRAGSTRGWRCTCPRATPADRNLVADAVDSRELLPLTALTGQFPTEPDKTYLAYAEAVSAIDHLVRISNQDTLLTLIPVLQGWAHRR